MKSIAIIPVFREVGRIGSVIERFDPSLVDEICLVLDDPSPRIKQEIDEAKTRIRVPVTIRENPARRGIGYAIKQGYDYALSQGFELIVVMAGNGKDDPREIPRITAPVLTEGFEYVQGSRFLPGGYRKRSPFLRGVFSRLFPFVWTLFTGVRVTDVTNGFRAYKSSILRDPRVHVWQSWLDDYELEYYLHYKVLTLGYRFLERPVSKIYPYRHRGGYSHIFAPRDWWKIVGPLFLLRMGARN